MINFNTILSSYDERGTLLKWLKSLQEALEGGALSTVTTTTGDDYVIFHFIFADGTSVDSPSIPLEAGPQGPQGEPGPQGAPGVDGEDGAAATVEIGTVTTLAPGADATVTNSGTSAAAVLNFGIPQGATGDPGEIVEQIVPVESTTTASRAYSKNDYFINNLGILTRVTANIAQGATIDTTNSTPANKTLTDLFEYPLLVTDEQFMVAGTVTGDDHIYCFVPYNHADKLNTITVTPMAAWGAGGLIFNAQSLPSSYTITAQKECGFYVVFTASNDVSTHRYKTNTVELKVTTT